MKNIFKLGFLGLALALSVVACSSDKRTNGADSSLVDSSTLITDTNKVDTINADTVKKDTLNKVTLKTDSSVSAVRK